MKTNRLRTYPIGFYLWLGLLLSLLVIGVASAQDQPPFIGLVHEMEAEKTNLSNPVGMVFSSQANIFHVVESRGNNNILSDIVVIKNISAFGRNEGSTSIKIGIDNPINMAMDNKFGRLLIYKASSHQLIEVYEDSKGDLDPNTLTVNDVSYFGLQDAQGMAFDPMNGYLYFLDAVGPRLVRINVQPDGSFTNATIDEVNLSWAGTIGLHGVAFDPTTGNFHAVSPGEQSLYEFTNNGEVVAIRDLSEFNLSNPQSIIFAPSGDQTDDPMESSLYLADSSTPINSQNEFYSADTNTTGLSEGKIVELSLVQPLDQINADFTSALVKTTDTAAFSPPSPDPTGLTYLSSSNRLLISDADVEETKLGITHFMGVNLWEVSLAGTVMRTTNISMVPPTNVPMTNEPTGVAWNPGNGHYYFTDDHGPVVFDLNPGIDGLIGTADDSWTSFSLIAENGDPEGITYDTWHDRLFVIDGANLEIYQYTLTGIPVNQFDVEILGVLDPESVEFNSISSTLFILSNLSHKVITETDLSGNLLQTIDISASLCMDPSGLAYAPASGGSEMHFYIVDRRVDNDTNPNEIDGKMYEMTAPVAIPPANTPPVVNAGPDQYITFGNTASLSGSANDEGLPSLMTTLWSAESGPGTVIFADPALLSTTASFSLPGTYVLRLTAYDGEFYSYNEINIFVTSVGGSSIFEVRVVNSSDDAEEYISGIVDLVSPDLELVFDTGNQTVGLRFAGINLPKNALINNAYIQFQTDEVNTETPTSLNIWGEAQDNPGTFLSTNLNISSRSRTSATVFWSPPFWAVEGEAGVDQRTPNINTILHEIIYRPGWSPLNSLVIIIGGTGLRTAESFEGDPSGAPRLHVEYTISTNHAPVAVNDAYSTNEDTPLSANPANGVRKNDTDADGDPLTVIKYTNPAHGTLNLNPNGGFTYTPTANYNGPDSFTYYVYDGQFNSNIATVNLTINPVNDAPVITEGASTSVTMSENGSPTPFSLTLNAMDADVGDTLSWSVSTPASNGVATASGTGTSKAIGYTPNTDYYGSDSFVIQVSDGQGGIDTITVNVTILAVNNAPVITEGVSTSVTMSEDSLPTPFSLTLHATDADVGDTLTWSVSTPASNGIATASGTGTSKVISYIPTANYYGSDSFVIQVSDGHGGIDTIIVNVTISAVNDVPIITEGDSTSVTMSEDGSPTPFSLTLHTTDPDIGDTLTWSVSVPASNGIATASGTGTSKAISYIPTANYFGSDSFVIQVSDGNGGTDSITINVTISSVNDVPIITEGASTNITMSEDGSPTPFNLTLHATDADEGDILTWSVSTPASNGTAVAFGTGTSKDINYTPNANYNGSDTFVIRISDGHGGIDSIIVNVTISAVNDAPVAFDDAYTTDENIPLSINNTNGVLSNDTDVDGNTLFAIIDVGPTHGTLTLNADGSFLYTPNLNYYGSDSFTYHAWDSTLNSNTATVNITIKQVILLFYLPVVTR